MRRVKSAFSSLTNHNYRLFFVGQAISVTGTWMQKVGQAWLVLELSGSGTLLGITVALQHLPSLLIAPTGGLLADRVDKRKILIWTSMLAGGVAFTLGALTYTGRIELWGVMLLALLLGIVDSVEKPTRQAFVIEMVGLKHMLNAVTLTSVVQNAGKIGGPAIAGILIATIGLAFSFLFNAVSYSAVLVGLLLMRKNELHQPVPARRERGQLLGGFLHVRQTPGLLVPMALMATAGLFAYEWVVTLPLMARDAFGGGADTFAVMLSVMGLGAVLGGLVVAGTLKPSNATMFATAGLFSLLVMATAITPSLPFTLVTLFFLGGISVAFKAVTTSLLQLRTAPAMRGRVMGLVVVTIGGTTPIGGPLVGWIGEHFGARVALGQGGVITAIATVATLIYLRRRESQRPAQTVSEEPGPEMVLTLEPSDTRNEYSGGLSLRPHR